ncbi:MAG: CHASE2 domain-containing protein, partial [Chthoniobacterales bacterium]
MNLLGRLRERKKLTRALAVIGGSAFAILLGLLFLNYSLGKPIARLSYDLPFLWRATLDTKEVVIVYLDEFSAKALNQPIDNVWNRALHARLLDRLTDEKARLVFYDIVFDAPAADSASDAQFAAALARNGKVILGAAYDIIQGMGQVEQERVSPPIKPLRKAAAGYGVLAFRPLDADYGVREIFFGPSVVPSATWKAAEVLDASVTKQSRESLGRRWLNYYGPRDTFTSVSIAQALQPGDLPGGYFHDKIVLVGGRSTIGYLGTSRDEFASPYTFT